MGTSEGWTTLAPSWIQRNTYTRSWETGLKWSTPEKSFKKTFPGLEPGEYFFTMFTGTWEEKSLARPGAWYSGVFSITRTNRTAQETEQAEYQPLTNLTAWQGNLSVRWRQHQQKLRNQPGRQFIRPLDLRRDECFPSQTGTRRSRAGLCLPAADRGEGAETL